MASPAEALKARFVDNPATRFTEDEIAVLAERAAADLLAAKIVALSKFKARDFEGAIHWFRDILGREASAENVNNLAVSYRDGGHPGEAIAVLEAHRATLPEVLFHDLMCSFLFHAGRRADARAHGNRCLELKDREAPASPPPRELIIRGPDVERPERNVISFSVFGTDPRYLSGAVNNAIVANYLYPGWRARFYTDASTPDSFHAALRSRGADVIVVDDLPAAQFGLFWRFLVEDDEEVDVYLVRDADSIMTVKERAAVAEWLDSGKAFHVMRDSELHSELVLAGLWGAHRGNLGAMRDNIVAFCKGQPRRANDTKVDQQFLRESVWPLMRQSVMIHDSVFDFMSPHRFDPRFALPSIRHVGQDDWVFRKPAGK